MSKKRTPKTQAPLTTPDADVTAEHTPDVRPSDAADDEAVSDDAPDALESERRPKGKKRKRDKKDKAAKVATAAKPAEGDKGEKKDKRGKKNEKEKSAKSVKASKQDQVQDKKAKRDKPRGKKDKSTVASKLRPLRKVNVLLIEPDGQPRAHFDGEIGVLDLLLPKKAEGDDSGA